MPTRVVETRIIDPLISAVARSVVSGIVGRSADRGIANSVGVCKIGDRPHSEALVLEALVNEKSEDSRNPRFASVQS